MRLMIGGACQGKTAYAMAQYGLTQKDIREGASLTPEQLTGIRCIRHFELFIKRLLNEQQSPQAVTEQLLLQNPDILILMDEIGSGIIPMERSERIWREEVGRIGCFLAERAESVERMICGLAVRLK